MGKIARYAIIGAVLWLYGKANRTIGYAIGTIDTLGATNAKEYEKDFDGLKIKLTKIEDK